MLHSQDPSPSDEKLRACQACSAAKAKCVPPTASGLSCSRCQRLGKECVILPRSARKKRTPHGLVNIGQLEQRIESLVTLLSHAEGSVAKHSYVTPPACHNTNAPSIDQDTAEEPNASTLGITPHLVTPNIHLTAQLPLPSTSQIQIPLPLQSGNPSTRDGGLFGSRASAPDPDSETPFEIYRQYFDRMMPFSFLPAETSASALQEQKPWLYRTCSMVGMYKERARQADVAEGIMLELSQDMLVRGKQSLDMLQSLILHESWSYYYSRVSPSKQSHAGFQLAVAMLYDLGLAKQARGEGALHELLSEPLVKEVPENSKTEQRSTEERRTLLACYVIASTYSLCVRKIDVFPSYSPYIGYCCESLLNGSHNERDILLVSIVRLQSKVEAFYRGLPAREASEDVKAPMWMHVKALEADLKEFWSSLPANLQEDFFMVLHFKTAQVFLYEPSLQKSLFPSGASATHNSRRLDMLYACLLACQAAADHLLHQPRQFYATLSKLPLSQLGHTCSTLMKLSLIEEPGWDLDHVRQTVSVVAYLEIFIARLQEVGSVLDQYRSSASMLPSMPTMGGRALMKIRTWYEFKVADELRRGEHSQQLELAQDQEEQIPTTSPPMTAGVGGDFNMDIDLFDFNDPYWLDFAIDDGMQPT